MENCCQTSFPGKPYFFKVLNGDFERRLMIPPAFLKHISGKSEIANLQSPSGSCWPVKLNRTAESMSLEDGWGCFSRAHNLSIGEFLVFRYDGDMNFTVQIFATSALERKNVVNNSQKLTKCQGGKRCDRPPTAERQGHEAKLPKLERLVKNKEMGAEAAAYYFTSNLPYFVTKIKAYSLKHAFQLNIPAQFSRDHLPCWPTDVTLRNAKGKMWTVRFHIKAPLHIFTTGWKEFSLDNSLRNGDFCVLELVDELELRVHIFRV